MITKIILSILNYPRKLKKAIQLRHAYLMVQLLFWTGMLLVLLNHFFLQWFAVDFILWFILPLILMMIVLTHQKKDKELDELIHIAPFSSFFIFELIIFSSILYRQTQWDESSYDEFWLFLLPYLLQVFVYLLTLRSKHRPSRNRIYLFLIPLWILGFLFYSLAITV